MQSKDPPERLVALSEAREMSGLSGEELLARARKGGVRLYRRDLSIYLGRASFLAWMRREGVALPRPLKRGYVTSGEAARRLDIPQEVLERLAAMEALRIPADLSAGHWLFSEAAIAAALDVERRDASSSDGQRRALFARLGSGLTTDETMVELEQAAGKLLTVEHAWWLAFLLREPWPGAEPVEKQDFFATYFAFCERAGKRPAIRDVGLGKLVKDMCGPTLNASLQREVTRAVEADGRIAETKHRPYFFVFPPRAVLRDRWEHVHGPFPWPPTS